MATFGEFVTRIQDYAEYTETSFVDNIPTFIKNAEERIFYLLQLPFFKRNVTAAGSAGNRYLAMPSDFRAPLSLAVTDGSGDISFLLNKDVSFMREVFPGSVEGLPKFYGLFEDNTFILAPIPDISYTFELHYAFQPVSLTSGDNNTTTWLSINATDALFYGAMGEAYLYMKGDEDLLAKYEERFVIAIKRLQNLGEARDRKDIYRDGEKRIPE